MQYQYTCKKIACAKHHEAVEAKQRSTVARAVRPADNRAVFMPRDRIITMTPPRPATCNVGHASSCLDDVIHLDRYHQALRFGTYWFYLFGGGGGVEGS